VSINERHRDERLREAIIVGDRDVVVEIVREAVENNEDVVELLNATLIPALRHVGDLFSTGEVFLPEMLVAARAMQGGIDLIDPLLGQSGHKSVAKVCVGTVKGDIHDIGKNLVVMMLKGSGFEVEDLGVDCQIEDYESGVERGAEVVCMSALLSTTRDEMRPVADHFSDRDGVVVVVGGAVVNQEFADEIGADGYGTDASDAVRAVRESLGLEAITS